MSTVAGVFASQADAEHGVKRLSAVGLAADRIALLAPNGQGKTGQQTLPTSDAEQPGMGKAVGGVVGGAAGLAEGFTWAH